MSLVCCSRKETMASVYRIYFKLLQCSSVPVNQKIDLVKCLFSQTRRICSHDAMQFLRVVLVDNGYPIDFTQKYQQCSTIKSVGACFGQEENVRDPFWTTQWIIFLPRAAANFSELLSGSFVLLFSISRLPMIEPRGYSCVFGSNYLSRTGSRLSERMGEQFPRGLTWDPRYKNAFSSVMPTMTKLSIAQVIFSTLC